MNRMRLKVSVPTMRAFTLIELMITVAIIGVLSLLAVVGYSRWVRSSKTGEATSMIAAIKGAQDVYRNDTMRYLDVSGGALPDTVNASNYHPGVAPSDQKSPWDLSGCTTSICNNFRRLNVNADGPVYYRYGSVAGGVGSTTAPDNLTPPPNDIWFIVKAIGDLNNDGKRSYFWSSSWNNNVWSKDPEE